MLTRYADDHLVFRDVVAGEELLEGALNQRRAIGVRLRQNLGVLDEVMGEDLNISVGTGPELHGRQGTSADINPPNRLCARHRFDLHIARALRRGPSGDLPFFRTATGGPSVRNAMPVQSSPWLGSIC